MIGLSPKIRMAVYSRTLNRRQRCAKKPVSSHQLTAVLAGISPSGVASVSDAYETATPLCAANSKKDELNGKTSSPFVLVPSGKTIMPSPLSRHNRFFRRYQHEKRKGIC